MKKTLLLCMVCLIALAGCKKGTITIENGTSITLHSGETHQISANSSAAISYTSSNNFYAKVTSTGLVTAKHVGNTTISLRTEKDAQSVRINVAAKSNLYTEPKITFGMTEEKVKSILGNPYSNTGDAYLYVNCPSDNMYLMVTFENGVVDAYAVRIGTSYATELGIFLKERYEYYGYSGDYLFYGNAYDMGNATKIIGVAVSTTYIMVAYMQNPGSKGNAVMDRMFEILNENVIN